MGKSTGASPLRVSSSLQYQVNKKEKREGEGAGVCLASKKSKPKKLLSSRELNGTEIMFYHRKPEKKKNLFILLMKMTDVRMHILLRQ